LPMDNLVFRFLLEYWPVLIAVAITLLLVYQFLRPKLTTEDLHKGLIQQGVLKALQDQEEASSPTEEAAQDEWRASLERVAQLAPHLNSNVKQSGQRKLEHYITVSLVWILLWIGVTAFIAIRIILEPYYYGGEAIFLGYFAYYIVIGLISYYKR